MANSNYLCLVSITLLSVVFALSTYPTMALIPKTRILKARVHLPVASSKLVAQICKKVDNPRFCLKALSGPKAAAAKDLNQLMKVAMGLGIKNAQATLVAIKGMVKNPGAGNNSPQGLKALRTCVEVYKDAIRTFRMAIKGIVEDPQTTNYDIALIGPEASDCDKALTAAKIQARRITVGNRELVCYQSIGFQITNAAEISRRQKGQN